MRHIVITTSVAAAMALSGTVSSYAGISIVRDQFSKNAEKGMSSRSAYQAVSFDQQFDYLGGITVKGLADSRVKRSYSGKEITSTSREFHVESDRNKPVSMAFDRSNSDMGNGKIVSTQTLDFDAKPMNGLNLSMNLTNKRTNGYAQSQRELTAGWALTKGLNFSVKSTSTTSGSRKPVDNTSYRVSGSLPNKVKLIKNIKFIAAQSGGRSLASAIKFDMPLLGGNLGCQFADRGNVGWNGPFKQVLSFAANSGKGNKLKFESQIKTRGKDSGICATIRNTSLTYALSPKTSIRMSRYNNKETPFNTVDWVKGVEMSANTQSKKASLGLSYKNDISLYSKARHVVRGLNLAVAQDNGGKLSNSVSLDSYKGTTSVAYTVKYDRQISKDQFVTLSTEFKSTNDDAPGVRKSTQTWLDLRTLFF